MIIRNKRKIQKKKKKKTAKKKRKENVEINKLVIFVPRIKTGSLIMFVSEEGST